MREGKPADRMDNVEGVLPMPNWFGVHVETQNEQMRTLIDAIRSRLGDAHWSTDQLKEVAEELNEAAVAFTNKLYEVLPEDQLMFVDGKRVIQRYERDVLLPRTEISDVLSEEEGSSS